MRLSKAVVFLCLVGAAGLPAAASNFNDYLPGAKAMGMGMAFSAVADDAYAMFYNPAGTANTPYTQAGFSVGRLQSPVGTMSAGTLTYLRPFDPINTATVGAAYSVGRQVRGGDKDEFLFHYAQELRLAQLPLTKPLKIGGNFKIVSVDRGSSRLGAGFDGGVLLRSGYGLTAGFGVRDVTTDVGVARPTLFAASAFTYDKWLIFAADIRVRSGLTEVYPGLEASFHQGLLKARVGRGFQLDGVGQMAFGLGVNFSPVVLDVAMTVPASGINRQGGAYQMSFNYKFGAPSFAGNFVGQAAAQAQALRADISRLEERRRASDSQAKAADTNREISEAELHVVERRVRELQDQYLELQKRKDQANYAAEDAILRQQRAAERPENRRGPVIVPPVVPREPSWPRSHEVRPGETLRSLAKAYYGDANLWERIYEANRQKVERGLPQEGSILMIPQP